MIIRVWRGRTSIAHADGYERFLKERRTPTMVTSRAIAGGYSFGVISRTWSNLCSLSFWDSIEALAEYTGGDPERPKYYPEDRAALLELPEGVEHYQVVDLQVQW